MAALTMSTGHHKGNCYARECPHVRFNRKQWTSAKSPRLETSIRLNEAKAAGHEGTWKGDRGDGKGKHDSNGLLLVSFDHGTKESETHA